MCLFQPWFPQGICLGVGLLGHMVVLFLVFKATMIKILQQATKNKLEADFSNNRTPQQRESSAKI